MKKPIFNHRTIIGYATNAKQAEMLLNKMLKGSINTGWKITVRERDTSIIDLPAGFVYSIHP